MKSSTYLARTASLALAIGVLLATFFCVIRPWYQSWGATEAEQHERLPGDEIVPNPRLDDMTTRAVTIRAAPQDVWPWVAQLGQDRGGFYSFELLEDLVGCQMTNANRIHPEFQHWKLGDKLWMYPPSRFQGQGHALLVTLEPGRALGFATRQVGTPSWIPYDGSWSFILQPQGDGSTRLLARGRAAGTRGFFASAFDHFVFEPVHFVMERKMLSGIKLRAEGGRPFETGDVLQVVLWTIVAVLMGAGAIGVLHREDWRSSLGEFVLWACVFQLLTLVQPSVWIGILLVSGIAFLLAWRTQRSHARARKFCRQNEYVRRVLAHRDGH